MEVRARPAVASSFTLHRHRISTSRLWSAPIWAASSRRALRRSPTSCSRCRAASTSSSSTRGPSLLSPLLRLLCSPLACCLSQLPQAARPDVPLQDSVQEHCAAHAVRKPGLAVALLHCGLLALCLLPALRLTVARCCLVRRSVSTLPCVKAKRRTRTSVCLQFLPFLSLEQWLMPWYSLQSSSSRATSRAL